MNVKSLDINQKAVNQKQFIKLKTIFPDVDDDTIARMLLARNNKLSKAELLLRKNLAWRTSPSYPVLKVSCLNEINTGKLYVHGVDKDGHLLLIYNSKRHIVSERDIETTGRAIVWWVEYTIRKMPETQSKYTLLMNRVDATQENQDMELTKYLAKHFQDMYPERLKRVIVYPAGWLFYAFWNLCKWFVDPVTRGKVQPILQLAGVQQFIDDQYIPASIGGKSTYEFNSDDYQDPYPEDVIASTMARYEEFGYKYPPLFDTVNNMPDEKEDEEEDEDAEEEEEEVNTSQLESAKNG